MKKRFYFSKKLENIKEEQIIETINRMAEYILEMDEEKEWCNMDNCDYKNSQWAKECIIRYFSRDWLIYYK